MDVVYRARESFTSRSRLYASLDRLRKVETADGLAAVVDTARVAFRFSHVTLLVLRVGIPQAAPPRFLTTYPAEWIEIYHQKNYLTVDPVIQRARTAFLPFDWSSLVDHGANAQTFFSEARSFGIGRNGMTIPVRAPNGERSLLSVTSDLSTREWRRHQRASEDALFVFAFNLHDRFVTISGLRASNIPLPLSRRERQCLELLGKGFLFKQIAAHLEISESAVRQYIRLAKRKLSASTVSQATARAAALEIISV